MGSAALTIMVCLMGGALSLDDGLCRTPIMGMNSWTAFGSNVNEQDLLDVAHFFVSSGLRDKGYKWINTDDGWDTTARDANGRLQPDVSKFPSGIDGLVKQLGAINLSFGIYTAESSVVCSGRPGTLFQERIDAQTFVDWGVGLVKNDNCGEYSYGNARFHAFADAVAALGSKMIISTEPFSTIPNPNHARFAHYWRTGNDISANWQTILNRIDINDKWARFAGPGHFNDPDMLQVGNGQLTLAEQRAHFALWAITKSTLILGTKVSALSHEQLDIVGNEDLIAINQDALGVQAQKLAINGSRTHHFVGLAPCAMYEADATYPDNVPGPNGVTKAGMVFFLKSLDSINGTTAYSLVSNETGRCLGIRPYVMGYNNVMIPALVSCAAASEDKTQAWGFPSGGPERIGAIQSLWAVAQGSNATVLAVANATLYGSVHGKDGQAVLDGAYGITQLILAPYAPEAPCHDRGCQDYDPSQSWYISPRSGTVRLAAGTAEGYRCYEPGCYMLTSHLPAYDELCLARVASISKNGVDPTTDVTGGTDVYGGPLANGAYVFGLLNRNGDGAGNATIHVEFSWLDSEAIGDATTACVRELYSGTVVQATGKIDWSVAPHDMAVLRITPNATKC